MANVINEPGEAFRVEEMGFSDSAVAFTIETKPVASNEIWDVRTLAVIDDTNNATRAILKVGRLGVEKEAYESGALTAAVPEYYPGFLYLTDGEHIQVTFYGTTLADKCRFIVTGLHKRQRPAVGTI